MTQRHDFWFDMRNYGSLMLGFLAGLTLEPGKPALEAHGSPLWVASGID